MNYQQALDFLYAFVDQASGPVRPPPELNLTRTTALLEALGDPQRSLRCVVIAGTKGKGSTAALIEAIARAAGLRVGLWTSPHLHSYRERIQIDRQMISQAELARAVAAARPAVEALARGPHGAPTTFAIGFGIALRYFADNAVDLAVLEVGLGGRYDSANVITPILSVITSISYDHMDILGDTLAKIAYDKAGIIKPGVPAITVPQQPEALEAIERAAAEVGAPLYVVDDGRWAMDAESSGEPSSTVSHPSPDERRASRTATIIDPYAIYTGPHETGLKGTFQRQNARLATGAALLLRSSFPIEDAAIGAGLAGARWAGRLEIVAGEPPTVIDGAHNGDSARELVESIHELFPGRGIVLVFGSSRNKDLTRMIDELAPHARAMLLTRSQHPRALTELAELRDKIAAQLGERAPATLRCVPEPADAIREAQELAGPRDLVCVTGSLFVVAAAREALGLPHVKD